MILTTIFKISRLGKLRYLSGLVGGVVSCLLVLFGPSFASEVDYQIQFWENRQTRDPHDYITLTKLGTAYLQKSREKADFHYIQKSVETLEQALAINKDHYGALVSLAFAFGAQHKFQQAIAVAEQARHQRPTEPEAYGILGDALFERGDVPGARKMYTALHAMSPGLFSLTRLANIQFIEGNVAEALEDLSHAIKIGVERNVPAIEIARCHVQKGEIHFLQGNFKLAEQGYQEALKIWPEGYLPLEHLAELRASQSQYEDALSVYQTVIQDVPNPEFHEAIGDVYVLMEQPNKAEQWYSRAHDEYRKLIHQGQIGYFRHLALLNLKRMPPNPTEALAWAKNDLDIRQDVYTYDTLAWAYFHNQLYKEALQAITKAQAHGTQDATIFFHAGMIHYRLGNLDQAQTWLENTLHTNPNFSNAKLVKETLHLVKASQK